MRINNNLMAMNTHRQLGANSANAAKSIEKLSSGLRINKAGDDAAGLSISEKMRSQIRGLNQASRNAQDGISMIQTAEGALSETHSILQRMRELAVQSATGTNTDADRAAITSEATNLKSEIDRIGDTTEFNTQKLLNGSLKSAGATVGANSTNGAVIAKLTAGNVTGSLALNAAFSGASAGADASNNFVKETIKVDGTDIDVHWESLSTADQNTIKTTSSSSTSRNASAALIVNTINAAIDASGKSVAHVTGYIDSTGKLVVESGSKGTDSKVVTAGVQSGILALAIDKVAGSSSGTVGTSIYNGTTIAAGASADLFIGNTLLNYTTTNAVTNGTTTMAAVASNMQTDINGSISNYNTATGKTAGEDGYLTSVTVTAGKDGRIQIANETGPVRLVDQSGSTMVKDLGLSDAQTSAAGNGGMTFQIGANKSQTLTFGVDDMRTAALGISSLDVSTAVTAQNSIATIDSAIAKVSDQRSKLGAVQNRLEHTTTNLDTTAENLQASESRIRDVDMAKEMMTYTKNNILSQAAQAMLAQANQAPQGVLQLLR